MSPPNRCAVSWGLMRPDLDQATGGHYVIHRCAIFIHRTRSETYSKGLSHWPPPTRTASFSLRFCELLLQHPRTVPAGRMRSFGVTAGDHRPASVEIKGILVV